MSRAANRAVDANDANTASGRTPARHWPCPSGHIGWPHGLHSWCNQVTLARGDLGGAYRGSVGPNTATIGRE